MCATDLQKLVDVLPYTSREEISMKVQVEAQNTGAWVRHVDLPAPVGASTSLCEAFVRSCNFPGPIRANCKSWHVLMCWQTTRTLHAQVQKRSRDGFCHLPTQQHLSCGARGIRESPSLTRNIGCISSVACCIMLHTYVHNLSWCSSSLNFNSV